VDAEALLPGSDISLLPGQNAIFQMKLQKRGRYRIDVVCRAAADLPDTAQLPLSVSIDQFLLGTQVLTGGGKAWQTLSFTSREIRRRLIAYLKLFCPVGGLEIASVRIVRTECYE
jgi:beta-glucosidase